MLGNVRRQLGLGARSPALTAHCPVFFAVTTQSVSLLSQLEHRKRSLISGILGASRSQIGVAIPFS